MYRESGGRKRGRDRHVGGERRRGRLRDEK